MTYALNKETKMRRNSRVSFERLLGRMSREPAQCDEIAREIDAIFGQDKAILVLDMSGFSRTTRHYGILVFLMMIHQMRSVARGAIEIHGGLLVKAEADNLYCLFDTTTQAVRGASEIIRRLDAANLLLAEERRLYASIGIGYGRILNIDDEDMFGDEVNIACKLGEDVAERGEILLTSAARAQLGQSVVLSQEKQVSISGMALSYHLVKD